MTLKMEGELEIEPLSVRFQHSYRVAGLNT
jgi:hypothetical protein